jgi:hypothetical protein
VHHLLSSAHFAQSNARAEGAVKTAKRLLMSNLGPGGNLSQDSFLRAMLQLHKTPDPDCSLLLAQIVFGQPLRDAFLSVNRLEKYSNPAVHPAWRNAWEAKEQALKTQMACSMESLGTHSCVLHPLAVGEKVFIQNQCGNNPNKWDKSGVVVECKSLVG